MRDRRKKKGKRGEEKKKGKKENMHFPYVQ
jgi:hypothetical protein